MLHDFSLRCNSPTINLNIQPKEFINFVNNLTFYITTVRLNFAKAKVGDHFLDFD
ncbi:DUF1919 domain-containing protein [Hoylesella buccalis]|uniref:DUF1919 domain-containing protein n=1 Tax=Hoylesella buccalis TaxID=28127 RepID=UPI003992591A